MFDCVACLTAAQVYRCFLAQVQHIGTSTSRAELVALLGSVLT